MICKQPDNPNTSNKYIDNLKYINVIKMYQYFRVSMSE